MRSYLLIDAGNTRIKWALVDGTQWQTHSLLLGIREFDRLGNALATLRRPEAVAVSNVRGEGFAENLQQWVRAHWGLPVFFAASESAWSFLRNGYSDPRSLGVDRWLGLIGALGRFPTPFCVVDLGTAITADWVDDQGQHQGGIIAPGIHAMVKALLKDAHDIDARLIDTPASLSIGPLGSSTSEGVHLGVYLSAAGLIEKLVLSARRILGDSSVLILTGGDAQVVSDYLEVPYEQDELLVLRGLEALVLSRQS